MPTVLTPRDSAAIAYEQGRRDAMYLYPARVNLVPLLALPAMLVVTRATNSLGAGLGTGVAVSGGVAVWSYRQTQAPTPAPPDSMQTRYGLSDVLWRSYVDGFENAIDQRREARAASDVRSAVVALVITGLLVVTLPRALVR